MSIVKASNAETIRDAYHDTMRHRRYRQQVQLDTHYFNFNDTIVFHSFSLLSRKLNH